MVGQKTTYPKLDPPMTFVFENHSCCSSVNDEWDFVF